MFGCSREAVRVKVKKCETRHQPEYRKFSVDPQITSIEVLQSILIKAFDIKGEFTVSYRAIDDYGSETYLFLLSDWDLDAAFISASEPYLYLQVNLKPFGETGDCECYWEQNAQEVSTRQQETGFPYRTPKLPGLIMNKMERTLNMVQRALGNLGEESQQQNVQPPRPPLTDAEFRRFLDPIGQVVHSKDLRAVIYFGGIEPSLRKVVWKHILNVYPEGMSGRERMDYMKRKAQEYQNLRERWRMLVQKGQNIGDLGYVTSMVRKDVLRTDRHHKFYGGSDDNQNTASLFNILTTYALNHPSVSYCQGMSDLASPLLVTMRDEAQAYICLCALMRRLKDNFMLDGIAMTTKFAHLAEGLQHYDPDFYAYLKSHQADDLLFCYRWLLLEMKREFALDDALRMLEVLWAALPASPPTGELGLAEVPFPPPSPPPSPNVKQIRENAYTKVCAIRRQSSSASIAASIKRKALSTEDPTLQSAAELNGETKRSNSPYEAFSDSENDLTSTKNKKNTESTEKCLSTDSIPVKTKRSNLLELKDRLSNKEQSKNSEQSDNSGEKKCARVVKNLNEFLNFTSLNRSKVTPSDAEPELRRVSSESGVIRVLRDDPNSPDDSTDFFPMTTSMTRELRLELESLDRQVFGLSPPSEMQCDCVLSKRESDLPESETETELARCSPAADVFVWENPLHTLQQKHHPTTPDEQAELEYDGEILEDQNGVKSVTPIRLLKCTNRSESASDSEGTESWHQNPPASESPTKQQQQQQSVQEQCEEATELTNLIPAGTSEDQLGESSLPPPNEFGGGNPFLMFLCITLLLQHRDFVMRNQMDYNEMAMHFDKMIRRHNVIRVLNQARQLFAGYLRRHSVSSSAGSISTGKPDYLFKNVVTFRIVDATINLPTFDIGHSGDIYFEFKTTIEDAVIIHSRGPTDYIKISINSGNQIHFQYVAGGGPLTVSVQTSYKLADDRWHSVSVERNRKEARIVIDGALKNEVREPPGPVRALHLTSDLVVGAATDYRDGFVGCIRALLLNGHLQDLRSYARRGLYGVTEGCTGRCESNPCLNNGTCHERYDGYWCDCRWTAFKGPICADEIGVNMRPSSMIKYDFMGSWRSTIAEKIRVGFTTTNPKGFLLGLFSNISREYMTIMVSNSGHLRVVFDFGFERQEVIFPYKHFGLGQYHDIRIGRKNSGSTLIMQIDNYEPKEFTFNIKNSADAQFNNIQYMYIGKNESMTEGFAGCISRVEFDDIYPLKLLFQENGPANVRSLGTPLTEDFCGVEPITHPPDVIETRPPPQVDEEKVRAAYNETDTAILGSVLAVILIALVIMAILIGRYMSRHKGEYLTQEDKGAEIALDPDSAVVNSATGHQVQKKKEWFI